MRRELVINEECRVTRLVGQEEEGYALVAVAVKGKKS